MAKVFIPSPQQISIFDFVDNPRGGCAIVEAVAGAGKTTTLVKACERMTGQVALIAYNTKMAKELRDKTSHMSNIWAKTFHSFGMGALRFRFKDSATRLQDPTDKKVRNLIDAFIVEKGRKDLNDLATTVAKTVSMAKQRGIGICFPDTDEEWTAMIDHFDLANDLPEGAEDRMDAVIKLSRVILRRSNEQANNFGVIDFDDMVYLPLLWNLRLNRFPWVLVDECQPAGTMVTIPCGRAAEGKIDTKQVPIETLQEGDTVVSYNRPLGVFKISGDKLSDVRSHRYIGNMHTVKVGERTTRYTDSHWCWASMGETNNQFFVYLMRRGSQFRVGHCASRWSGNRSGLSFRMYEEKADAIWVLKSFGTKQEAENYEATIINSRAIPGTRFEPSTRTIDTLVTSFWDAVVDNTSQAERLLIGHGRSIWYPFMAKGEQQERDGTRFRMVRACNLLDGMLMRPFRGVSRATGHDEKISVTCQLVDEIVYSLEVENTNMYVADDIATHNCQDTNPTRREMAKRMLDTNGRLIAVGDPHQAIYGFCQPAGTMVKTPLGEVPIESLSKGDKVIISDTSGNVSGWAGTKSVLDKFVHPHTGNLLSLSVGGNTCEMSPNHKVPVKLNPSAKFYTYMMKRRGVYRVGYCAANTTERFMFSQRCLTEMADCGWLLESYDTKEQAANAESLLLERVKGTTFNKMTDEEVMKLPEQAAEAIRLLDSYGRMADFPLWVKGNRHHFEQTLPFVTEACNVMDGMRMACWSDDRIDRRQRGRSRQVYAWESVSVSTRHFEGLLYGISVPVLSHSGGRWPLYFANNILVHNSGADNDSLDQIRADFRATTLPLTVTYRCPKTVVDVARRYVSHITAHGSAPDGAYTEMPFEGLPDVLQAGDAVLCRYTKYLVALCFRLIRIGKPARIEGRAIGAGLVQLARKWKVKNLDTLVERVKGWEEREVAKASEKNNDRKVIEIQDKVETLFVLIDRAMEQGIKDVDGLCQMITGLFDDDVADKGNMITLCSVHRSKGLEFPRVFILGLDELMGRECAQPWQTMQERNLQYVAVTRAQELLVNVTGVKEEKKQHQFGEVA